MSDRSSTEPESKPNAEPANEPIPDPDAQPAPPSPGERRLARPPSDRYRAAEERASTAAATTPDPSASAARGIALAFVAAVLGGGAIVFVGGVATLTTGLLAVAGLTGLGIALGLLFGAGQHMVRRRRVLLAIGLAIGAVALGQLGLWQYGRSLGGVLPLVEYLGEVYGPLVIAEFAIAAVVAGVAAR